MNIPDDEVSLLTLSDWLQKFLKAIIKVTEYLPPKDVEKKFENISISQIPSD